MQDYKKSFIQFAIEKKALKFGEFTLKSGRTSPYFFNAGTFNSGRDMQLLGRYYAEAIIDSKIDYDVIFGPAYKGIPLATATALMLANEYNIDKPFCFNRKEAKQHGEGGSLVGAPLEGRSLIVDDVITAGTAIRESISLINNQNATPAGIVVALDRQEKGNGSTSAIQEIEKTYNIPVVSIINLDTLIDYLGHVPEMEQSRQLVSRYREQYGV